MQDAGCGISCILHLASGFIYQCFNLRSFLLPAEILMNKTVAVHSDFFCLCGIVKKEQDMLHIFIGSFGNQDIFTIPGMKSLECEGGVMQGTCMAMASRSLFCSPVPICIGAMKTFALA